MTEPLSPDRPWKLLIDLRRLVAERPPAEAEIVSNFTSRNKAIEKEYQQVQSDLSGRYEQETESVEADYVSRRRAIITQFESEHSAAQQEYDKVRSEALTRFRKAQDAAKQQLQEARWEAPTIFEATKDGPDLRLGEVRKQLGAEWQQLQAIGREAARILQKRRQWRDYPEPQTAGAEKGTRFNLREAGPLGQIKPGPFFGPKRRFAELVTRARHQLRGLFAQTISRLFEGAQPFGVLVLLWLIAIFPAGLATGWQRWYWIAASGTSALVIWTVLGIWFYRIAKRQCTAAYLALRTTLAEADLARQDALNTAKAQCEQQRAEIAERLENELEKAQEDFSNTMAELDLRKKTELEQADEKYPALLSETITRRDNQLQQAQTEYSQELDEINNRYESEPERLLKEYTGRMAQTEKQYQQQWEAMADRWGKGIEKFQAAVDEMNQACRRRFPDWNSPQWSNWTPATDMPGVVPFARIDVDFSQIEGAIPEDQRLRPARTEFTMPAMFAFGDRSLMLLRADGAGRARAIAALQAVMLRMLASMPPGKVRFMIVDPVGLGENFSAFMHLADYDEQLVSSRIWTESQHIEQRLADLTEHMETVIQVYLRNEFQSIQEYNDFAGELAEPYRILVLANFPANFSEAAARRLLSIGSSGARCGVYTLLSADTKLPLPRGFRLADLQQHAVNLNWNDEWFEWEHPQFGTLPLAVSEPPEAGKFTNIVRSVGESLKDADRVEVPFQCVAPEEHERWTGDGSSGIDIPLGRAGAMKLQHLRLGRGTSQHVLIAGKTGSGKSTLLHALITNLALRYSPDETQLYLVDFKKGVEFKAYATFELPHARVIAIESEREFGLSVLQRLDAELRKRGDLFRKRGVQDLQSFRKAEPDVTLPRILLIIDEFQELFVEDDRIAQSAALLLDRLVRQGRAFGIHVLLGSQTLAGAYSLPRATIGQMAVRIALQCSESDAHLILSEENTAARLLTRPGEAIYNDANGLYEGNHPFQVVWLPDHEREECLKQVRRLARDRHCTAGPPIVFEGNVPADPSRNIMLGELLEASSWPEAVPAGRAWLGAAVAIKDPTVVEFARQTGSNMILVGHREEAALGVLAASLISLAAQHAPADPEADAPGTRFFVFDGTRPDAPEAGFWNRLGPVVPQPVTLAGPRQLAQVMAEVAEELSRREQSGREDTPPVYLFIYNLSRFRDLRKAEDDFGFSRPDADKPASPAQQLADILREGPALGIHTLLWCDTYNNAARWLDRQGLRDIEMRVLFQMNATDSSNLIDSPAAGRLGVHRAILYNEGHGRMEKFRPYCLPSGEWLDRVKQLLHGRT